MAGDVRVVLAVAVALAVAGVTPAAGGPPPAVGEQQAAELAEISQDGTATEPNETVVLEGGFDPDYDPAAVLTRVEALRELSATEPITLHEYDDDAGPEIDVRDQFGEIRPAGARALQLYSNATTERRMPLGYAVERGDGVHIYLMNATDLAAYGVSQEVVLAHEFVHALQFQRDLLAPSREGFRSTFPRWTTDARLVTTSLVEGDATWTTEEYVARYGGDYSPADYNRTLARAAWPNSLGGTPYYYGYEYYRAIGAAPDERSAAIRSPPNSTAELLDSDGAVPRATLPEAPASSQEFEALTRYHTDTVGELALRHALRINGRSFGAAAAAADGLANDRMYYYAEAATTATHWVSVWESPDEAAEFEAAWRELLDDRGATPGENETLVVPTGDDAPAVHYVVERDGDTVRITAAPDPDLAVELAAHGRA
ncbi:hypothetical protein [Halorussus marinus]|uniref:hypothetical protein n=1 Tax=Halorussus marinus TaxID=2505976 RepID=UPI00106E2DAE|nr:hypothetical protein [Halorussus marinus]